jgi:hypothetical protein
MNITKTKTARYAALLIVSVCLCWLALTLARYHSKSRAKSTTDQQLVQLITGIHTGISFDEFEQIQDRLRKIFKQHAAHLDQPELLQLQDDLEVAHVLWTRMIKEQHQKNLGYDPKAIWWPVIAKQLKKVNQSANTMHRGLKK